LFSSSPFAAAHAAIKEEEWPDHATQVSLLEGHEEEKGVPSSCPSYMPFSLNTVQITQGLDSEVASFLT